MAARSVVALGAARAHAKAAAALAVGALALGVAPAQAAVYFPEISAKGTNGYKISVAGLKGEGVSLAAVKGKARKNALFANYSVRGGDGSRQRLRADFGRFGRVDMRFVPKGDARKKKIPRGCTGKPDIVQPGVWKGVLKFEGTNGFTKVNVRSARGKVTRFGNWRCKGRDKGDDERFLTLFAQRKRGKKRTIFTVDKADRPSAKPSFSAAQLFKVGKVRVSLSAFYRGRPDQFMYTAPDPNANADVSPKGPFSGEARYRAGKWHGNLRVKLPGLKRVKLTGRGFKAQLTVLESS
jgi:hypothetical protein